MAEPRPATAATCSECGAQIRSPEGECCWLCATKLPSQAAGPAHGAAGVQARSPLSEANPPFQFSLATALWIVTFAAVEMGLLVSMPGVGIVVGILALPALVRTRAGMVRKHERGVAVVPIVEFLTSMGVMALIGALATGIFFLALYLTLLATCTLKNDVLAWFFIVVGGLTTLVAPLVLLWRTWPRPAKLKAGREFPDASTLPGE